MYLSLILIHATDFLNLSTGYMNKWHHSHAQWGVVLGHRMSLLAFTFPLKWSGGYMATVSLLHIYQHTYTTDTQLSPDSSLRQDGLVAHEVTARTRIQNASSTGSEWHLVKDNCSLLISTIFRRPKSGAGATEYIKKKKGEKNSGPIC